VYLQCKHGFIEADAWDGKLTGIRTHDAALRDARKRETSGSVVVVRSRRVDTIADLIAAVRGLGDDVSPLESPLTWDYEWRAYLTSGEFATFMATVALSLDYRNFKSWCQANDPPSYKLAHDLWDAAHADGERRGQ
jgi:hypothetical protein